MVTCNCEASSNNLTTTEPCKALNSKQSSKASIIQVHLQLPVLQELLKTIQFLPECIDAIRDTIK